jgi:hypothetical protein
VAARQSAPDTGRITVPSLNRDPVQSLQPWPVVVTCLHEDLTIPALPAVDWLTVLMVEELQLDDVFPGLLSGEDEDWVEEQLLRGRLELGEYERLTLDIIENASARKWYVTLRLVDLARRSWDAIGSELMLRGVDAARISLSAWLDVLLITILRNMEPKDVTMFTSRLETPPPEETVNAMEDLEMSRSAFMALGSE